MSNVLASIAYSTIQIDKREIEQSLLDIKDKKRSNLFAWNGQFSPQFIEALLDKYATPSSIVADPFLGSGTVLCECARKRIAAFGSELNPSAYYMAKSYELCILNEQQRMRLFQIIDKMISDILVINGSASQLETLLASVKLAPSLAIQNTLSLLVVLVDLYNNTFSSKLLLEKWDSLKFIIRTLPYSDKKIRAFLSDARKVEVDNDIVDLIITSPPYINVFNYHQKYRRSVEALGYNILKIARQEVGSNRKNRGNRFLTVIEYCLDMSLAIKEMIRISKLDARIIIVVGRESNVLANAFSNSELIYKIASDVHGLPLALKQQRVFKNKFGQMIYEDILHFKNTNTKALLNDTTAFLEASRQVGITALKEKLEDIDVNNKNYSLLVSAIDNGSLIKPSEANL